MTMIHHSIWRFGSLSFSRGQWHGQILPVLAGSSLLNLKVRLDCNLKSFSSIARMTSKSAQFHLANDAQLKEHPPPSEYSLARNDRVEAARSALDANGMNVVVCESRESALEAVKALIPPGAGVNQAGSTTLEEIGYIKYVVGAASELPFTNYRAEILKEKDASLQAELRRKYNVCDVFLTSCTAITEQGEITVVDASGTRVGPLPHAAKKVVVIAGSNKIVPSYAEAVRRTEQYCLPLESARVRHTSGGAGSIISNFFCFRSLKMFNKGRVTVVLVKEALGY